MFTLKVMGPEAYSRDGQHCSQLWSSHKDTSRRGGTMVTVVVSTVNMHLLHGRKRAPAGGQLPLVLALNMKGVRCVRARVCTHRYRRKVSIL